MKIKKSKRKEVCKGEKPLLGSFRLQSKCYFLTYKGISENGENGKITKNDLANYLLNVNPNDLKIKPEKYLICQQKYDSGQPHFHVVLIYQKRRGINTPDHYDYLGIHPNIQTMRNMKAALQYVYKQDPHPLTNMDVVQQRRKARAKDSSSLYQLLQQQMKKDPFNFDVYHYCNKHDLFKQVYKTNYSKAVNLIVKAQQAHCNALLRDKPGFRLITRQLITQSLSPQQLILFDSWSGYQKIVDYLNQIVKEKGGRQQKSLNLLITGLPNTGKSALVWQRNPIPGRTSISSFCSIYPIGMSQWFPKYQSDVYHCIYWNEAKLTSYSYDTVLKLLDGSPMDLSSKGSVSRKIDNPLVIMTSNMTLQQMIKQKFSHSKDYMDMARANLAVRVQNVIVPPGYDLFLLQKLLKGV